MKQFLILISVVMLMSCNKKKPKDTVDSFARKLNWVDATFNIVVQDSLGKYNSIALQKGSISIEGDTMRVIKFMVQTLKDQSEKTVVLINGTDTTRWNLGDTIRLVRIDNSVNYASIK